MPNTRTSLAYAAGQSPVMRAKRVVFPLPFGPLSTHRSPRRTVHERRSKRTLRPNLTVTSRSSTTGSVSVRVAGAAAFRRGDGRDEARPSFSPALCLMRTFTPSATSASISFPTAARLPASRPANGSTRTSRSGRLKYALANRTRCISPLERDENGRLINGSSSNGPHIDLRRLACARFSLRLSTPTSKGQISNTCSNDSSSRTRTPSS